MAGSPTSGMEYVITDEEMVAIADAIRAKTGNSETMTPAQMVTEIGSIQTGGGWELIAEATASEDVEAFRVDIPAAKQNMAAYLVEFDCVLLVGTGSGNLYACPRLNEVSVGVPYTMKGSIVQISVGIAKTYNGKYNMVVNGSGDVSPSRTSASAVEYVALVGYYAGNLVQAGSKIKVYGIGEPT